MGTTEATLKKLVKANKNGRYGAPALYVAEVDGACWYTESHFACEADTALGRLLGTYNLEVEPGVYAVNGTVSRMPEEAPPNVASLIPQAKRSESAELVRSDLDGRPLFVQQGGELLGVWQARGQASYTFLNATYMDYLAETHPEIDGWTQETPQKVAVGWAGNKVVALVMPVRVAS